MLRSFCTVAFSLAVILIGSRSTPARAGASALADCIYDVGELAPRDSRSTLNIGDPAPEFRLPAISGEWIDLSRYRGEKNVVLSFVPAAWTPVCSAQWPQYHDARAAFEARDTVLLGITVDNLPTLYAWTKQLSADGSGFWFPVLSDFYPHGAISGAYGVLRSSGTSERALFVIDKRGLIRYQEVMDINRLPHFDRLEKVLSALD